MDYPISLPSSYSITQDSKANYLQWLNNNRNQPPVLTNKWGLTGLMTVVPWVSSFYGTVVPGTFFLFPGYSGSQTVPYYTPPQPSINGKLTTPIILNMNTNTMHAQLVNLLVGSLATNFIGLAIRYYPLSIASYGYSSTTCNNHWFQNRDLPQDPDWRGTVYQQLANLLLIR